ncbi:type I inositol polyphosphate 5-phosphatase 8-like [Cryptomeria japonica]|uniref:type I inositol polyphosphate 5-phosphatase 8-like n=1 Tax=Cryptomeria japonica TaxID=3369 RepID=UPI0027DA883B|nr:type I inositol polyphosphate 5-phosphatase 8-like [Cryptomeria japonica]
MTFSDDKKNRHSWPKLVVRKWLNIKSKPEEFHADEIIQENLLNNATTYDTLGRVEPYISRNTKDQDLRVFVGTWNVGGEAPHTHSGLNLDEWVQPSSAPADIYVFGFQEIVILNAGNVLCVEDNGPAAKWLAFIRQTLNININQSSISYSPSSDRSSSNSSEMNYRFNPSEPNYCLVASKQMIGVFLCVWVRSDLRQHVRDIKVSCVGCGLMGYLGNKGSVSISMLFSQTSFCFVCTHLTSGEKEGDELQRNSDVREIIKKTHFPQTDKIFSEKSPERILEHDRVIWLGDLNYRLALQYADCIELMQKNNWETLLEKDQLQNQREAGHIFEGWNEGKIYFPPTYKYCRNSDQYAGVNPRSRTKRRKPAWCDRILWYGEGIRQLSYVHGESKFSDHRPVYSMFVVEEEMLKKSKLKNTLISLGVGFQNSWHKLVVRKWLSINSKPEEFQADEIIQGFCFDQHVIPADKFLLCLHSFDIRRERSRVIWLGDLNYRRALQYADSRQLVIKKHWKTLLEKDRVVT